MEKGITYLAHIYAGSTLVLAVLSKKNNYGVAIHLHVKSRATFLSRFFPKECIEVGRNFFCASTALHTQVELFPLF